MNEWLVSVPAALFLLAVVTHIRQTLKMLLVAAGLAAGVAALLLAVSVAESSGDPSVLVTWMIGFAVVVSGVADRAGKLRFDCRAATRLHGLAAVSLSIAAGWWTTSGKAWWAVVLVALLALSELWDTARWDRVRRDQDRNLALIRAQFREGSDS